MGRPHIYPEEFRREACELVRRGDRSQRQIAADLGIPDQTLNNWMQAESHAKVRAKDPNALTESELAELKRLRKENADLKTDREILSRRQLFSPGRRTAEPLSIRLRPSGPVLGHGTVPGHQGLTQRLLRLGQQATVTAVRRGRLLDRHHPGDPSTLETHLWSAEDPRPALSAGDPGRTQAGGPTDGPRRAVGVHARKKWRRGPLDVAPAGDLLKRNFSRAGPMSAGWPTSLSSRPGRESFSSPACGISVAADWSVGQWATDRPASW